MAVIARAVENRGDIAGDPGHAFHGACGVDRRILHGRLEKLYADEKGNKD
jgi:hypothetical protein